MKVLLSAYSCEPGQGSERGVGWNVVREVARHHEVWVLTRPDESKDEIEAELEDNPITNLHFVYFTLPFWQNSLRLGQSGAMQLHYYLWQIQAYWIAKQLYKDFKFDVIHHVTFVRYACPSFLSFLPVPFVWGPVGGGESTPLPFWVDFSWKNKLYEIARLGWRSIGEFDPFTHITARRSAIALVTTQDTEKRVRKMHAPSVKIFAAIGISGEEIEYFAQCLPPNGYPVRFISIARLLHWKGLHLGLRAFAQAQLPDAEYWIIGDGPEKEKLYNLALSLGVGHQVKFWGLLPREKVLSRLGECSVLVHPSLHDSGAGVCLEAMAAGRPVISLDLGGPAEQITPETGFKVPAYNPEESVKAMAEAMGRLANDENLRLNMGRCGQERVKAFYNWEVKGQQISQVYKEIVALKKC